MRISIALAAALSLAACQAPATKTHGEETGADEPGSFTPGLQIISAENEVTLLDNLGPNAPPFRLACKAGVTSMDISADQNQLAQADAKAGPGEFNASGQSFKGTVTLSDTGAPMVAMVQAITPDLLAAIQGATTVRLMIGNSFAETSIDSGNTFEDFVTACAAMTGVTPTAQKQ